jgi:zinc transporter ZupT
MTDPETTTDDMNTHEGDDHHHHGDGADHDHGVSSRQLQNIKTMFLILYLLLTYLGMLPYAISMCRNSHKVLSVMNCFAAGVFLSIALIHLLPEGSEQYYSWAESDGVGIEEPFPLPYTVTFVGYLIAILIDRVIFFQKESKADGVVELTALNKDGPNSTPGVQPV